MLKFKSLQRKLFVLLVAPVALFLAGAGLSGYYFLRDSLLKEWQEIAVLRMERAAHQMDMRLQQPVQWLEAFAKAYNNATRRWVLEQLRDMAGVNKVVVTWGEAGPGKKKTTREEADAPPGITGISPVTNIYAPGKDSFVLQGNFLGAKGKVLGRIEVTIAYDYLMKDILTSGWMQTQMACLVTKEGQFLAHSDPSMKSRHCLGEGRDPLELAMLEAMKEQPFATLMGQGYTPDEVIGFYRLRAAPWAIMLHAQGSLIMAPILRFRLYYLGGCILCLLVILLLIRLGTRPLVSSVRRISQKAAQVAHGEYGEPLPVESRDEIGQLTQSFNEMVAGLQEKDLISNTFGRYVDREIARELLSRPEAARLGGQKREVVILFSDIRGFTPLAESLTPEAIIHLVNRHFSRMIEVISRHHGIIVDFLGDALLAFFDPLDGSLDPQVQQAVRCALEMQEAMAAENAAEPEAPQLQIGIGLHAGEVVVGNIGSEYRAKYGIIGAAVNLTHRIQGQAQGGEVMVSDAVYRRLGEGVKVNRSLETRLKGIHDPVTLYVISGEG
jgi:class 3 adenylate cyclase